MYVNPPVDAPIVATVGEPIRLEIGASNVGAARWLSKAHQDKGVVRLGWRWFKDKQELTQLAGRVPIHWDVFPGQFHRFQAVVAAPDEAGVYSLVLGLVSELVASFDSVGTPPVSLEVEVREAARNAFANMVEPLRLPVTDGPLVALSTKPFRHHVAEPFEMTIHIGNGERRGLSTPIWSWRGLGASGRSTANG